MNWLMGARHVNSQGELAWVIFGLCAQLMFTAALWCSGSRPSGRGPP